MRIQRVQNNMNFKGEFPVKDANFERLKKNLSNEEKALWNKIVQDIEKSDDPYRWGFSFFNLYSNKREFAGICRIAYNGLPYHPAMFTIPVEKDSDALEVFKSLYKWYQTNVKGFNGIDVDNYKG